MLSTKSSPSIPLKDWQLLKENYGPDLSDSLKKEYEKSYDIQDNFLGSTSSSNNHKASLPCVLHNNIRNDVFPKIIDNNTAKYYLSTMMKNNTSADVFPKIIDNNTSYDFAPLGTKKQISEDCTPLGMHYKIAENFCSNNGNSTSNDFDYSNNDHTTQANLDCTMHSSSLIGQT